MRGAVLSARTDRPHVITQVTEHPAVLETNRSTERLHGTEVTYLPVDRNGLVDPAALAAALTERTVLVSVMAANNETGALQPLAELTRITRAHGTLFHCDATQAAGKIPLGVSELGVDLLTVVGHKMYAPRGIAALYVRRGTALEPLVHGGGQEGGLRAGTENVALAVALGTAAELAAGELADGTPSRIAALRDGLHRRLADALPGRVRFNGPDTGRLPNTLNVGIDGVLGHGLLAAAPDLAASTGSACHSGTHTHPGSHPHPRHRRAQPTGRHLMTAPEVPTPENETAPAQLPDTDVSAAHASVTLLERLADKLSGRASVTAVHGEPITADGITIIPVAKVGFGFGGGAGREVGATKNGDGGGGAEARPLGCIKIRDGTATYKPIRDPWSDVVLPLAALAIGGAMPKIFRSLRRRGR